jgi:hypothetical protein
MNVTELIRILTNVQNNFPTAAIRVQGWNDQGDLMDFPLRGDARLERDAVGNPVVVLR